MALTLKRNKIYDNEVGIEPTMLALSNSNIKMQMIDIADDGTAFTYDATGVEADLTRATGFREILGTILINGKLTAKPDYNPATKKIIFYDAGGNVTNVTAAAFPIRLLVIGV